MTLIPLALAVGQSAEWGSGRSTRTRAGLEELLRRLEQAADSPGTSEALRAWARAETELVRTRLREGDFRAGDRLLISVEGEAALSDTFPVTVGPAVVLPTIGEISLRGVLRSELESHLKERLGVLLHGPVVRAQPLIRVSVLGEVGRPGFYVFPLDMLPEEALMAAGGPTATAKLNRLRVERGDSIVWQGEALRRAMTEGRTLDDLGLRAGDRLVVPRRGTSAPAWVARVLLVPVTIYAIRRLVR
jgi:protein involved in polysaccharide export with SLBB domain